MPRRNIATQIFCMDIPVPDPTTKITRVQHYRNRRFAISGFWQMQSLHEKLVFPIKWNNFNCLKFQLELERA